MNSKWSILGLCFFLASSMQSMQTKNSPRTAEFLWAARSGDNKKIEQMIAEGFDINSEADSLQETAVTRSIQLKRYETTRLLVGKGARVRPFDFILSVASKAPEEVSQELFDTIDPKALEAAGPEYLFCFMVENASFDLSVRVAKALTTNTRTGKLVRRPSWIGQTKNAIFARKFGTKQTEALLDYVDIPKKTGLKLVLERIKTSLLKAKN